MRRVMMLAMGLLVLPLIAVAQREETSIMAGVQSSRLDGVGESGDEFEDGLGYVFELGVIQPNGWGFTMWGLSTYWSDNVLYDSRREFKVFQPYFFEVRRYFGLDHVCPFIAGGVGFMRMKPDDSQGYDNCYLLTTGVGIQLTARSGTKGARLFIQAMLRPSYVMGNSLEKSWNIERHIGIGIR